MPCFLHLKKECAEAHFFTADNRNHPPAGNRQRTAGSAKAVRTDSRLTHPSCPVRRDR